MHKIFRIYASQGPNNYAELDLPASDYEMLDLMERLRLEPGQAPQLEILKYGEEYDYLNGCIHNQPDVYQLNALARKLSEFTSVHDMAAFEGFVGKETEKGAIPIDLPKLIDFAYSTDYCHVAVDAVTDTQLGEFLVENGFIEEADSLPESALALLDYGKIGREHREQADGIYTGFGYVEQHSEVRRVSETMDFQPHKPAYMALLCIMARSTGRTVHLELPVSDSQMRNTLEKLAETDWNNIEASVRDSPIPRWKNVLYCGGEIPQINELAYRLRELDEQGQLPKYKAILETNGCEGLAQMIAFAGKVDEYILAPRTSSPEDLAREELRVVISSPDAETLLPHVDLAGYGRALLERYQSVITRYGMLARNEDQQVQDMEHGSAPGGMVMG